MYLGLDPAVWTVTGTSGTGSVVTITLTNSSGWTFPDGFSVGSPVGVSGVGTGYNCTECTITATSGSGSGGTISYASTGTGSFTSGSVQLWVPIFTPGGHKIIFNALQSSSANAAQNGSIELGPSDPINSYDVANSYTVTLIQKNTNSALGDTRAAQIGDPTHGMVTASGAPAIFNGPLINSTISASTSPICPNGTSGAFTTAGCSGGGGGSPGGSLYALQTYASGPTFGGLNAPTTPPSVPQVVTSTPTSGSAATAYVNALPGLLGRPITGTTSSDTILATDCDPTRVEYVGSVSVAVTLPTATTLGVPNCMFKEVNWTTGSGTTVTVTPTTWTVNGNATLVLAIGQEAIFSIDPNSSTNWIADVFEGGGIVAGTNITLARTAGGGVTIAASANTVYNLIQTSGSPYAMSALTGTYWNNTSSAYSWDLPTPAAGLQICVGNYQAKATAQSLIPPSGVTVYFKGVAGTPGSSTGLVSNGAAGDFICLEGTDSATYMAIGAGYGTWTNH